VVISASLAGTGGLTIRANGSLTPGGDTNSELDLTGNNTFTGTLTISSGIVAWNNDAAFGAFDNDIVLDGGGLVDTNRNLSVFRDLTIAAGGGTLRAYGNANTYIEGDIKGSGTLNKTDLGGITLVRDDYTFTGPLNIQG